MLFWALVRSGLCQTEHREGGSAGGGLQQSLFLDRLTNLMKTGRQEFAIVRCKGSPQAKRGAVKIASEVKKERKKVASLTVRQLSNCYSGSFPPTRASQREKREIKREL